MHNLKIRRSLILNTQDFRLIITTTSDFQLLTS